ncbi:hypothetical protein [Cnuella takakiae]|uniref:hypothetical protein n=1 Tax=Cnuella takakiae TaxID=1302690 RepID=UPI001301541A|nr:hypothetical protein [Cnuella takakiae]
MNRSPILIVDDDIDDQETIEDAAEKVGIDRSSLFFDNGGSSLIICKQNQQHLS